MMGMLTIYITPSTITKCSLTEALAKQRPRRWNATHIIRTPKRHLFLSQNIYIYDKGVRVPESNTKHQASTQTRMTSLAPPPPTPCSQTSTTRSVQRQVQGHFESTPPCISSLRQQLTNPFSRPGMQFHSPSRAGLGGRLLQWIELMDPHSMTSTTSIRAAHPRVRLHPSVLDALRQIHRLLPPLYAHFPFRLRHCTRSRGQRRIGITLVHRVSQRPIMLSSARYQTHTIFLGLCTTSSAAAARWVCQVAQSGSRCVLS